MNRTLLLITGLLCAQFAASQTEFQQAYTTYSYVPEGLLEAVAWTNTRMVHLSNNDEGCSGIPKAYGIMGLHDNGKGYFNETGAIVAQLSGINIDDQKLSAENQIMAYAASVDVLMAYTVGLPKKKNDANAIRTVLQTLSEIPDSGEVNLLARDMQVYSILRFMNSAEKSQQFGFTQTNFNLQELFGESNYKVLSSKKITFTDQGIESDHGDVYQALMNKSIEYGPAIWNPAPSCNYNSRNGVAISAITIHTVQGTYAGAISWAQNCVSDVSYHYVIRSADGQVTQMVLEEDKAWHVGSENPYTIGYEHEGYVNNAAWYTEEMYNSSADLSRDIVGSGYGIPPVRTYYGPATAGTNILGGCTKIKGHQHFANQTHVDPGINWNWEKYYRLINDPYPLITITTASGNLYDTGGAAGNYPDDERQAWLIQPPGAQSITLDFTAFDLEYGYDNLFIYDGDTITAPLIGSYTGTTSPGIIISTGGSILLEFRSDCSTVSSGWEVSYTETVSDATPPLTSIQSGVLWNTDDFTVGFVDTDAQSGIAGSFYLAGRKAISDNDWSSDGSYGFALETFEDGAGNWTANTGTYALNSGTYSFSDVNESNSNTYMNLDQTNVYSYLYEWDQTITSTEANQRAGIHFFCDDPTLPNRGNSYFVYLRENDDKLQIYSVENDVFNLESDIDFIVNQGQTYNCKTYFDPNSGIIDVYIDDSLIGSWQDVAPLTSGNSISLRTGGCAAEFDNIRVYQSRNNSVNIPAGLTDLMTIESEGATPTGIVRSLALDSAGNWSMPVVETYLLDFSVPTIDFLNDGTGNDQDTFMISTLDANWNAIDIHSGIGDYEVAIGTLPTIDNIYPWTSNGLSTAFSMVLSSPVYDQVYHVSLSVTNQAGLTNQFMSDGQRYIDDLGISSAQALEDMEVYPNPASETITLKGSLIDFDIYLYDMNGKLCMKQSSSEGSSLNVSQLSNGTYNLMIKSDDAFLIKRLIIKH
jgi:hypothetical protein